jgi:hypothetical protein
MLLDRAVDVSIAVELISEPKLLVLDEPTSGLDSASALQVVQILKALARARGMAVMCTLHQPSHDVWDLLDEVAFMARGQIVYFGEPGQRLQDFFGDSGYAIPLHCNISDYILSLINKDFENVGIRTADLDALAKSYEDLREHEVDDTELRRCIPPPEVAALGTLPPPPNRASFWIRLLVLCQRDVTELTRDPGIVGVRIVMYTFLSFIIAVMFLGLGSHGNTAAVNAVISVLFYVAAFMVNIFDDSFF